MSEAARLSILGLREVVDMEPRQLHTALRVHFSEHADDHASESWTIILNDGQTWRIRVGNVGAGERNPQRADMCTCRAQSSYLYLRSLLDTFPWHHRGRAVIPSGPREQRG